MNRKKILIIDDDPAIRQGYQIRLKANGYETFFAGDAISGFTEARKQMPDLIILDLGLPAGDGFVVMGRLRAMTDLSMIPVLVVSARDRLATKERAIQAGAKAFLQKPVDNAVLLAYIRRILDEPVLVHAGSR
jgi:two-component system KDP operon response regulator KdpE